MLIIGIAGGSGSGKTTVVNKIVEALPPDVVTVIPQDAYYFDNGHLSKEEKLKINFDHPNSIEWSLLIKHLQMLRKGESIEMPNYDYVSCARLDTVDIIKPNRIIIVEGILVLTNKLLRDLMDIKLFVLTDGDDRLMRIISRDTISRGRSIDDVLTHYSKFVKLMHEQFIEPTKKFADVIIPQGGNNKVAIEMVVSRIKMQLNK
ncbi:MAG: uridine kinase [Marinilabiliales bacterium]|nr:MAG: uridine kinase [Marinilabiliales bacterium]